MKKMFVLLIIAMLSIICVGCGSDNSTSETSSSSSGGSSIQNGSSESSIPIATEQPEEKLKFTICTGNLDKYGTYVTFNKGKPDETKRIYYHIPAGTYKVSNDNKYMQQLNIYSDETHITEEGFEEPAEAFGAKLIEPFESITITIEDGQAIYFSEGKPAFFTFEQQ